jgi:hypothetical protein
MASIDPFCKQREVSRNRNVFDARERPRLHVRKAQRAAERQKSKKRQGSRRMESDEIE